jgi:hypothetical protein
MNRTFGLHRDGAVPVELQLPNPFRSVRQPTFRIEESGTGQANSKTLALLSHHRKIDNFTNFGLL